MSQGWSDSEDSAEGMPRAAVLGCPGQLLLREPEELLCSCCVLQLSPGRASSVGMSRRCPSDRSLGRGLAGAWLGWVGAMWAAPAPGEGRAAGGSGHGHHLLRREAAVLFNERNRHFADMTVA